MAKLYVKRHDDGTITVRMIRLAGKELAATKTINRIDREDFMAKVKELVDEVAPPRRKPEIF